MFGSFTPISAVKLVTCRAIDGHTVPQLMPRPNKRDAFYNQHRKAERYCMDTGRGSSLV